NGVRGGGATAGGRDVYSLGRDEDDGVLVLRWAGARVTDGPGADLVVFENAFEYGGDERFMDPVVVEVSRDGAAWVAFPHDYVAADETAYVPEPGAWRGFAGIEPVLLHEEDNPVDPFDRAAAGGDPFDLADLPADDPEAEAIRTEGFVYVRLVAATARTNPDTGAPFPHDPVADGPDVDGVYARHLAPEETP
ncbi:MAG: LIC_13355 family lipoprotein, partial [Myxococcota bacterium]